MSLSNDKSSNELDIDKPSKKSLKKLPSRLDDSIGQFSSKEDSNRSLKKHLYNKYSKKENSRSTTTALVGFDEESVKRRKELKQSISQSYSDPSSSRNSRTSLLKQSSLNGGQRVSAMQGLESTLKPLNEDLPNVANDLKNTKLFLQKQGLQNLSIWSHLSNVLNKLVAEQPENVIDYFEEYSKKVKQERLTLQDSLRDVYVPTPQLETAKNQLSLVNSYGIKEDAEEPAAGEEEEGVEPPKKMDLEEAAFYFHHAGYVIPDVQLFAVNISMKKLTEEKNLIKPRFWGKVLGIKQNYFVLECELAEEEYQRRAEEDDLVEAEEAERLAAAKVAAEKVEQEENEKSEQEENLELSEANMTKEVDSERRESIKSAEKAEGEGIIDEGAEEIEDETPVKDKVSLSRESRTQEVSFDLQTQDVVVEEEEDPLLPPLPPPKKLLKYKIPAILLPVVKEIIHVPSEKVGQGLNRKVYYVSNTPELDWIELPKVTPDQINVSRQIKVYFTGDLESKIVTYPAFPGIEQNYLRAQIARISAATQVSPLGFYRFGEAVEEEEEEEVPEEEETAEQTKYTENPNFQPIPIKDLIDPTFSSWVHHSQHILSQGRTEWWSGNKATAGEEEAEEEQEEEEEEEGGAEGKEEKETGPALLTPLSEDTTLDGIPLWSARRTHNYNTDMATAVIKSNLWPGACAFAHGKKFENVYIGWGHKFTHHGFSPAPLPHPEYEYDLGPEVLEIQDPTVEVEQTWRQAHKKKPAPIEGEEAEGEEEEEEEEEDEDD